VPLRDELAAPFTASGEPSGSASCEVPLDRRSARGTGILYCVSDGRVVEFGVHFDPVTEPSGALAVRGRIMADPVRVGDVFIEAEGPRSAWNEPSDAITRAALRVEEIRFFRHHMLNELEAPHAAELLLSGRVGSTCATSSCCDYKRRCRLRHGSLMVGAVEIVLLLPAAAESR
jgi:hypothetical protein